MNSSRAPSRTDAAVLRLARRAITLWRAWNARRVFGPQMAHYRSAIDRARKQHRPVKELSRRLREATHARLRAELGVKMP